MLNQEEISVYAGNKNEYKTASLSFLRQLIKDIGLKIAVTDSKVSFNPGGPAVAGDPSLYFMSDQGKGLAVYITEGIPCRDSYRILYRVIKAMDDHHGEANQWMTVNIPYESMVTELAYRVDGRAKEWTYDKAAGVQSLFKAIND